MSDVIYDAQNKFSNTKEKVKSCMERKEQCRNSDRFLLWYFWKYEEELDIEKYEQFKEGTSASTIVRCRREIQNDDGEFLPTDKSVLSKRRIKEEAIRDYYSSEKAEEILG